MPKAASVSLPAEQFYSDGSTLNWNQKAAEGQPEPEHPAPVLTLASASSEESAAPASTDASAPVGAPTWPGIAVTGTASEGSRVVAVIVGSVV